MKRIVLILSLASVLGMNSVTSRADEPKKSDGIEVAQVVELKPGKGATSQRAVEVLKKHMELLGKHRQKLLHHPTGPEHPDPTVGGPPGGAALRARPCDPGGCGRTRQCGTWSWGAARGDPPHGCHPDGIAIGAAAGPAPRVKIA